MSNSGLGLPSRLVFCSTCKSDRFDPSPMTVGSITSALSSMSQTLLSVGMNILSDRVSCSFIGLRAMLCSAA